MERIAMSQQERDWLDWLKRTRDGKMTQREAADRMGVSERWVRKLLQRMKSREIPLSCTGYGAGPPIAGYPRKHRSRR